MSKLLAILLVIALSFLRAEAQVSLNTVVQKYTAFRAALPGIRIHLVFNQEKYAPGDTVFFKAYFLKEDFRPVEGRRLIALSLVAPGGNVLQHFLFNVNNGIGANQIVLPEILKPGIYNVAAYNGWMKNIESLKAFSKDLVVVGETAIKKEQSKTEAPVQISAEQNDIRISSTNGSLTKYQQLYLLVTNKGKIIYSRQFSQGVRDHVLLGTTQFQPGANIIHVIDKLGREVGTTTHYVPAGDSVTATIKAANNTLYTRSKATIAVTVHDHKNKPVEGEFSFKIYNGSIFDSTQLSFAQSIANTAPVYEPWRQVLKGNAKQRHNYMTDLARTGTAYYGDGVTPLPAQTRLFFYLQEHDIMMQSMTLAGGKVRITIPEIKGGDVLFYMAESEGREISDVRIAWDDTTIPAPAPPPSQETNEPDPYGIFVADKRVIDQGFGFEEGDWKQVRKASVRHESDLEARLKGPDLTVHADKFVAFATMEEMITEIIPAVNVRKLKGRTYVQMGLHTGTASSEPLYIIDGIATKNTAFFLSLKPIEIDRVKLITNPAKLVALGLMGRSGVIIVETKAGNSRPIIDPSSIINGINPTIPFPKALFADPLRPNLRSTVYWDPSIKTDANGRAVVEFECSDDLGPVYIRVDGITTDGRPFSGEGKLNFVLTEK
jgi:hypothetical protein